MKFSIMISSVLILIITGVLWGCMRKASPTQVKSLYAPTISASELLPRITAKDQTLFLLDVRQPEELSGPLGAIAGVVNIPLGEIQMRMNEVPKDKEVIVICRSGNRSSQATMFLKGKGYNNLRNLSGGMNAVRAMVQE